MELKEFLDQRGYELLEQGNFQRFFDEMEWRGILWKENDFTLKHFFQALTSSDCFPLDYLLDRMVSLNRSFGTIVAYNSIRTLKVPATVQKIDELTFCDCASLESIELPDSIYTLEWGVFNSCTSLKYIKLPVTLKRIRNSAFYRCTSLESIELPDSVIQIDPSAFKECRHLRTIKISPNHPQFALDSRGNLIDKKYAEIIIRVQK